MAATSGAESARNVPEFVRSHGRNEWRSRFVTDLGPGGEADPEREDITPRTGSMRYLGLP